MKEIVARLEEQVRSGHTHLVRQKLTSFPKARISRQQIANFAALAKRVGLPYMALRLLFPVVKKSLTGQEPASPQEMVEYGDCLNRVGASEEALTIFEQVSHQELPLAAFLRSLSLFEQWRYAEALPLLQFYTHNDTVSSHQKMVGRMSLIKALIITQNIEKAEKELEILLKDSKNDGNLHLYGSGLEMYGQVCFLNNDLTKAEEYLKESISVFSSMSPSLTLLARKWMALANLKRFGANESELETLAKICAEAIQQKQWDSARDCDLYLAAIAQDELLLRKVNFGTPYEGFRNWASSIYGKSINLGSHYLWQPGDSDPLAGARIFDVTTAKYLDDMNVPKEIGRKPHLVFWSLSRDFYKPVGVAEIFSKVCPKEFFDPDSGPNRIYQLLSRCRIWLKERDSPIQIIEDKWRYRLQLTAPIALRVSLNNHQPNRHELLIQNLFSHFGGNYFKAQDAKKVLSTSTTTICRVLSTGVADNRLIKKGKGPACRYRFPYSDFNIK